MKYKKRIVKGYDKFNSMTINSVPCSSDEFNCLRVNISAMGYNVNPGRHIRIIVKDKKSKKYLGVITLASDFSNLGVRDTEIGWSDDNKFIDKKIRTYVES